MTCGELVDARLQPNVGWNGTKNPQFDCVKKASDLMRIDFFSHVDFFEGVYIYMYMIYVYI